MVDAAAAAANEAAAATEVVATDAATAAAAAAATAASAAAAATAASAADTADAADAAWWLGQGWWLKCGPPSATRPRAGRAATAWALYPVPACRTAVAAASGAEGEGGGGGGHQSRGWPAAGGRLVIRQVVAQGRGESAAEEAVTRREELASHPTPTPRHTPRHTAGAGGGVGLLRVKQRWSEDVDRAEDEEHAPLGEHRARCCRPRA